MTGENTARHGAAAGAAAVAPRDFEFLAMGVAAPLVSAMLAGCAVLKPRWLGRAAAIAGAVYALRLGAPFTTDGPFVADGLLGLWLPVAALATWVVLASASLARRER
jgi:hypothetical protein